MKIYTLKTLEDFHDRYEGINGVGIYVFTTLEDAQLKMKEIIEKKKSEWLKDECCDEEDIEIVLEDTYFEMNDGADILRGEIEEKELDLDIFAITTVSVDPYEPASVSTYFRFSKEEAKKEYKAIIESHYDSKSFDEEDTKEDYIEKYVQHDYEFINGNGYYHSVEDSGDEFIVLTEKLTSEGDK